ncbi:acid protease [Macroventuria anomochaeta]|uniref:Acid protease n=1 Tax=Macroventuria anomochaeta TaxID=301207 RepID=A0ACB6RQY3_9PLEO|nr:acid protease [Macroventuria anomochaeta]KAF2623815.1 acid protease [Macroventuria anomochaeta]
MLLYRGGRCAYTTTLLLWTSLSLCSATYVQKNTTTTPGYTLLPGVSSVPAPIIVAPDQGFLGIDGAWNTFSLRVGSQQSIANVFPSTASQQIWVVNRDACVGQYEDTSINKTVIGFDQKCKGSRGYLFNTTESSTWDEQGFYGLWVGGTYGLSGNGYYGYDAVGLGIPGEEGPTVDNTTIGTLKNSNFWLGQLGLHPKPTNFSADLLSTPPVPSYMTRLFEQGNIPSLSFGYTAGVQYHDTLFLGSLTLGGYDSSRYISNNVSFVFSPDNERDLVVGLAGLTANTTTRSDINLLPAGTDDVTLLIDTTVAELWLPLAICEAFEKAFGLTYDNTTKLYLVDDLLHQTLLAQDPSVTFSLRQAHTTDQTVQITLPYAAFDLEAQHPYRGLNETTRYFPLRRGDNKTQWALGKTFLQEAYIKVDWERSRFNVYQCDWTYGKPTNVVSIVSPIYAEVATAITKTGESHTGVIVGIAVGCVFIVIFIATAIAAYLWRRRCNAIAAKYAADAAEAEAARKASPTDRDEPLSSPVSEKVPNVFPKAELPGQSNVHWHEMGTDDKEKGSIEVMEVDNTERPVYEMLGDIPAPQEAAGRQLSEKETMLVREKNINGVDTNARTQATSTIARPAPVASLDDIAMVNTRLPSNGVSPVTPRAPRNGAHLEAGDTLFQLPPYRAQRDGRSVDDLLSPISPLDAPSSTDSSRRRFSYES